MESRRSGMVYGNCRCCLKEGAHRNILKEYQHEGTREIYYNIFAECFNLYLSTNENISMLICTDCIKQLHDASSFKTLVMESERHLLNSIGDKEMLCVNVPGNQEMHTDVKVEVKTENSDVDDYDNDPDYEEEPEDLQEYEATLADGEADLLARIQSNQIKFLPGQKFLDLEPDAELVKGEQELLSRFKREELKPLPTTRKDLYLICPTFANYLDQLKGKIITGSMVAKLLEETEFKEKINTRRNLVSEKSALIFNTCNIIVNSNVTPFRCINGTRFHCFYCKIVMENLEKLKQHQDTSHSRLDIKGVLSTFGAEGLIIYVDVTDLKCLICEENQTNLTELKTHLIKKHDKKFNTDVTDRIVPFRLSDDHIFPCQICGFSFETFGSIERHMNVHFRNYVCNECGSGFVTKYRLKVHAKSMHVDGNHPCQVCKKVFASQQKLKSHMDSVHRSVKRFKCPKCPERFNEYFRRQKHLVSVHGVEPLKYKCNVCERSFDRRFTLSRHMKRDHLEERDFQCEMCPYTCFTNNELRVHMIKHIGERIFECEVCKKSYARKKTLKEHMRIHNNDRRFACAVCGQAFVQKCSLKGHMKTHHSGVYFDG